MQTLDLAFAAATLAIVIAGSQVRAAQDGPQAARAAIQHEVNDTAIEGDITVQDMAYHWAPVHYQDIQAVGDDAGRFDYITRLDRDLPGQEGGVWDLEQNHDKELKYPLRAYVYYSVVGSKTHWFVNYCFFHPWDTEVGTMLVDGKPTLTRYDWQTNDLEGVMFVIRRNGSWGELDAVLAQGHGFVSAYVPKRSDGKFAPKRLRPVFLQFSDEANASMGDDVLRVITSQQAGGHGAGCFPEWHAPSPKNPFAAKGGGDHIRYIPSRTVAEEPDASAIYYDQDGKEKTGDDRYTYCRYKLINVFDPDGGLWPNRHEPKVFTEARRTFIGHSSALWTWRGNKKGRFEFALNFTEEEMSYTNGSEHPFTHNPAHLCWVHLQLSAEARLGGMTKSYYCDDYVWNGYLEDNLRGGGSGAR